MSKATHRFRWLIRAKWFVKKLIHFIPKAANQHRCRFICFSHCLQRSYGCAPMCEDSWLAAQHLYSTFECYYCIRYRAAQITDACVSSLWLVCIFMAEDAKVFTFSTSDFIAYYTFFSNLKVLLRLSCRKVYPFSLFRFLIFWPSVVR